MARRPLGIGTAPSSAPPEADGSGLAATLAGFRQRMQDSVGDRYAALASVRSAATQRATPTAQIAFNPRTNKYVVGGQEFDANDIGALKALAEAPDLPEAPIPDGLEALTQQQVRDRFQRIYDNAEVDTSIESRLRGMGEAIAGIPRGIGSVFGADIANPLEGSADAWRRDNLTLREQAGRMHRPTESLVGAANALGQAIETGVPVLAAGALGSLASPAGGIAAGIAVAGGMAAQSQGDEAAARIEQALAQATPEQLQGNPEYMALRRAGNDHQTSVQELVRRGRTTAARYGAAIGGVSGAVAGPAGRFMTRGLPVFGNRFAAGVGDDLGENLIRALRGTSGPGLTGAVRTGFAPALRSSAGLGVLGAGTEGAQEFFETDVSQGLADVSAGLSRGYQMGQYGTADDFVGGAIGGAPFGAIGGLRTPTALPVRPTQQRGTADPGLNAALGGAVAPQNPRTPPPDPSGAQGGNRQLVPAPGAAPSPGATGLRPLGTNWTRGEGWQDQPAGEEIIDADFREIPRQIGAPPTRALPAPAWSRTGTPMLEDGLAAQQAETAELETELQQIGAMLDQYGQVFGNKRDLPDGVLDVVNGLNTRAAAIQSELEQRAQMGGLPLPRIDAPPPPQAPAAYDPEVVLQNAPGRPSAGVMAQAAQQRGDLGQPDVSAQPELDTQTPQMFGPSGGVTQAARRNDTLRESQRDVAAQIKAMLDPAAEKDSVWVPFGTRMPDGALPDSVVAVPTPVGTLLTTDPTKAKALRRNPKQAENPDFVSQLLGYTQTKSPETTVALEATTPDGAVADSELTTPEAAPAAAQTMQRRVGKTAKVAATTPAAALAGRTARVEQEDAAGEPEATPAPRGKAAPKRETTPSRQPTPDQTAGAVTVEVAPGRPPEERRRIITEMLAPLQRKIASKTAGKSEKAAAQAEADQLLAQLDALDAATQTGGRSPSKGSVQEGSDANTGRERTGDSAGRTPEAEAEEVLSRAEEDLVAIAREFDSTLDDEAGTEPDFSIAPAAPAPAELKVDGADAPVLGAAEMTVEVEGGESQVKPSAILDWYRKRIENLNLLKACLLK